MPVPVFRVRKARCPVFDGTGAFLEGGRWNSRGRLVVCACEAQPGSLLEILVHAGRTRKLPGAHHAAIALVPDDLLIESVDPARVPGWDSPTAREFGDRWLQEQRTAVLRVPAAPVQPFGRTILLNPAHPEYARVNRLQVATPRAYLPKRLRLRGRAAPDGCRAEVGQGRGRPLHGVGAAGRTAGGASGRQHARRRA
jgi:RES domain-containing protein